MLLPDPMVYDPVNGGSSAPDRDRDVIGSADVVAFDLVTREWTVLLEPSRGQPTPSPSERIGRPRERPEGDGT